MARNVPVKHTPVEETAIVASVRAEMLKEVSKILTIKQKLSLRKFVKDTLFKQKLPS